VVRRFVRPVRTPLGARRAVVAKGAPDGKERALDTALSAAATIAASTTAATDPTAGAGPPTGPVPVPAIATVTAARPRATPKRRQRSLGAPGSGGMSPGEAHERSHAGTPTLSVGPTRRTPSAHTRRQDGKDPEPRHVKPNGYASIPPATSGRILHQHPGRDREEPKAERAEQISDSVPQSAGPVRPPPRWLHWPRSGHCRRRSPPRFGTRPTLPPPPTASAWSSALRPLGALTSAIASKMRCGPSSR
jgi:hypothetical protein